jgi:hypothetical protein
MRFTWIIVQNSMNYLSFTIQQYFQTIDSLTNCYPDDDFIYPAINESIQLWIKKPFLIIDVTTNRAGDMRHVIDFPNNSKFPSAQYIFTRAILDGYDIKDYPRASMATDYIAISCQNNPESKLILKSLSKVFEPECGVWVAK